MSCFRNGGPASGHGSALEALRRRGMLVDGELTEKGELLARLLMVEKRLRDQAERDARLVVRMWRELEGSLSGCVNHYAPVRSELRTA